MIEKSSSKISVLWLRPRTGENVSTRRSRIAEHLENRSVAVNFRNISLSDPIDGIISILRRDYDVLIANVRFPLYISFLLSTTIRRPFIADVSDPLSQMSNLPGLLYWGLHRYEWFILRHADAAMFAESESYEYSKDREINSFLVKNSVNYKMFSSPDRHKIRFAYDELINHGVDPNSPVVVYPGRFVSAYHIEEIISVSDILDEWEFVFLGEDAKQNLVEQAADTKPNVYYLGSYPHEQIPGFLQHADVGLCLVDAERPLKILEYGAAMLPVLGVPGALEKEFSEEQMWFVDPTPKQIASKLEEIRNSRRETKKRCENMRQIATDNSWEAVADKYYDVIYELASP